MRNIYVISGKYCDENGNEYHVPLASCSDLELAVKLCEDIEKRVDNLMSCDIWNNETKNIPKNLESIINKFSDEYSIHEIELAYNVFVNNLNIPVNTRLDVIPIVDTDNVNNIKIWIK